MVLEIVFTIIETKKISFLPPITHKHKLRCTKGLGSRKKIYICLYKLSSRKGRESKNFSLALFFFKQCLWRGCFPSVFHLPLESTLPRPPLSLRSKPRQAASAGTPTLTAWFPSLELQLLPDDPHSTARQWPLLQGSTLPSGPGSRVLMTPSFLFAPPALGVAETSAVAYPWLAIYGLPLHGSSNVL